jgi:HD-like signal output (HDOD) protein
MGLADWVATIASYKDELLGKTKVDPEEKARHLASVSEAAALAQSGVQPLPESVATLLSTLRNPNFKVEKAISIVESDPALTADLMHLANSASNSRKSPCDSVTIAFKRLGARKVADLAVATHVLALANNATGIGRDVAEHSVRCASILRCFPAFRGYSTDRLFLCGLVHDLGVMLLDQAGEFEYTRDVMHLEDDDLRRLEFSKLGFDHATLGAVAMKMWDVPDPVSRVVAWHHDVDQALERGGDVAAMVAAIRLAAFIERLAAGPGGFHERGAEAIARRREAQWLGVGAPDLMLLWESSIEDALAESRHTLAA